MTDVPRILVQEEEDVAESCKNHPDILASIHNDAGKESYIFRYKKVEKSDYRYFFTSSVLHQFSPYFAIVTTTKSQGYFRVSCNASFIHVIISK